MKRPLLRAQAGVALIEFALVVPLLILVMLGLVELGRFAYFSILVGNAARAAAQYGAQDGTTALDNTGMQNAGTNDSTNNIQSLTISPTHFCRCWDGTTQTNVSCATNPSTACATGHRVIYVQVDASGTFSPLFNYPKLPSSFTVGATSIMRVINQ
jgi:Flp pilus assembly protein TadG